MDYNTATMIYGFSGFHRRENKLTPHLKLMHLMMESYEKEERNFRLTVDDFYVYVDIVTRQIHKSSNQSFREDFNYIFEDPKAEFVLSEIREHVMKRSFIRFFLPLMDRI
ncbi:hypothetical protein [Proteiniclasticum ruminis]|uniref:hypothetical protein n=1 Tax=Proteiniclasticum ruminis TaxID=398199 RepID=UPI0028ACEE1A|nr:hypothetical protein [Proteiniclasticum ruminis]